MIRTFRNKALKRFAETGDASKLSVQRPERLVRILQLLNAAEVPEAMNAPGMRFHALKGGEKGRYAVDASRNYRVTFAWDGKDAVDVDLEDYH